MKAQSFYKVSFVPGGSFKLICSWLLLVLVLEVLVRGFAVN